MRRILRVTLRVLLALSLWTTACGSPDPSQPQTRVVEVDASTNRFHGAFLAYFPNRVSVRRGDVVEFRPIWTGEAHTVTLGALVDKAFPDVSALPAGRLDPSQRIQQAVAQECYVEQGPMPANLGAPCPKVAKPAFNGRQTYYSSGFLAPRRTWSVKLAGDIAPGTYRYFCSFHGPRMSGEIVVGPRGAQIPSQGEVRRQARAQIRKLVDATVPLFVKTEDRFKRATSGKFPYPAAAGLVGADGAVIVREFVPFTITARLRERVTWDVWGSHVISFRPPRNSGPPAIERLDDGTVAVSTDSLRALFSPSPPPGAPPDKVVLDAGRHARDDTVSSGLLVSPEPGRIVYSVRFTEPGTYRYRCLIHPAMSGLVTVSL